MSDPLTDAANAISTASPAIRRFAQMAAARIIADEKLVAPAPPAPAFGGALPPRMAEATGPLMFCSSPAALTAALATAAPGTRIQLRAGIYGANDPTALLVKTNGTPQAPVCIEAFPGEQVTFALGAGSPAIGAGDPAYTPATDINGKRRVSADLGAVAA